MFSDPTFWVAVSFLGFIGVAVYFKLPAMINRQLDARAAKIAAELEQAQALREEAQALFAEHKRKTERVTEEVEAVLAQAREAAEALQGETLQAAEAAFARRQALAETRIAQAEVHAVQAVRNATIDAAIAAARQVMQADLASARADQLIDSSIEDVRRHLN